MRIRILPTLLVFALLLGVSTSTALAAPQAVCISTGSGNWSSSIWSCTGGPTASDIVIINDGHNVTLDTNGAASQLIVGGGTSGSLSLGSYTLNVGAGGLSISNGATLNGDSGILNVAGNLTNNGIFNAGSGTVEMNGTSAQSISGSNLTFNNLTINNSSATGVTLNSNATVNGTLTLTTDLTTASGVVLTMDSGANTSGDADVVGKVKRASFTSGTGYTFGSTYTVITPTVGTGGSLPTEIVVELIKQKPGGLASPVARYYSITSSGGSNYTFTLQLHYRDGELDGNDESKLQMWEQVNGRWTLRTRSGIEYSGTDNNRIWKDNLTSGLSSLWALDDSGAPTAVNLSSFDARADAPSALPFVGLGALVMLALGLWWNRR